MKAISIALCVTVLVLSACSSTPVQTNKQAQPTAQNFSQFKDQFLDEFWSYSPEWATYVGYYEYDDVLHPPTAANSAKWRAFLQGSLRDLQQFDISALSTSDKTDFELIKNELQSGLWYLDEFKQLEWNPSYYNVAGTIGLILNTDYKPLNERLLTIGKRLQQVPAYYAAAKQNIQNPTAEHTRLAIEQNNGALGLLDKTLAAKIAESGLNSQAKSQLLADQAAAIAAVKDYVSWLEQKEAGFGDTPAHDFRIGKELYEQKFGFDIVSNNSAAELFDKAVLAKQALHQQMIQITEQLWPKYFADQVIPEQPLVAVKQMIDHLSVKHIDREGFVDEVRRQIPIIQQFMDDKDLLDSDPTRPLVVRETPKYQRGIAGASIDAPGPYDATANTYYNVTPLDDMTPEQAESYLREYNHWILQVLNIHEAIPGHYTQLIHANKSPSKIKSIFANGAMIEGWAVYSERMMMEEGYGDNEPEMWLMYSKWNLRAVVNTILDYSVHVLGMTREQALDMLINEAFQEQTEAEGKWRRVTLSQVQLTSYFNGYAEIYAFREELKQKMGDAFDLKSFHNKFLSYGNAPVPVIRKLMLQELGLPAK